MAALVLDGYNLIGIQHRDLDAARRSLIEELIEYKKRTGHAVTLVFDGTSGGGSRRMLDGVKPSSGLRGGVQVVYSALGDKADHEIMRMIERSRDPLIIITSDREIQACAWAHGSTPVDSEVFIRRLNAGPEDESGGDDDDEEDVNPHQKKGSSHKPSKRDRELRRAIAKL